MQMALYHVYPLMSLMLDLAIPKLALSVPDVNTCLTSPKLKAGLPPLFVLLFVLDQFLIY